MATRHRGMFLNYSYPVHNCELYYYNRWLFEYFPVARRWIYYTHCLHYIPVIQGHFFVWPIQSVTSCRLVYRL